MVALAYPHFVFCGLVRSSPTHGPLPSTLGHLVATPSKPPELRERSLNFFSRENANLAPRCIYRRRVVYKPRSLSRRRLSSGSMS
ncbi:hypothetical protein BRADI_3g29413v3 [Brachypodium distachyon]|uniref:Uncharacterized protein n=1 Tax=Brachypodium distachyon TaxID=15368 RepID=A0A2K2CZZ4_BRADI|nr:hypothetical protein BRADI_3g29413v3 [Brachypodium distachyon]